MKILLLALAVAAPSHAAQIEVLRLEPGDARRMSIEDAILTPDKKEFVWLDREKDGTAFVYLYNYRRGTTRKIELPRWLTKAKKK